MNQEPKLEPGFVHTSKAWYSNYFSPFSGNVVDEVMIGMYAENEGTTGEFAISFHDLGQGDKPSHHIVPRIEMFQDSWWLMREFSQLFDILVDHDHSQMPTYMNPSELTEILKQLGFKDFTSYTYKRHESGD